MNWEHIMYAGSAYLIVFILVVMQWRGKLPRIESIQKLADVVNTKGGNILVLGTLSMVFFESAMRFTYWIIGKEENGKIDVGNAFAMATFTFISGTAFGGAFSSMIKTMTGEVAPVIANKTNNNPETPITSPIPQPTDKPSPNQAVTAANDIVPVATPVETPVVTP